MSDRSRPGHETKDWLHEVERFYARTRGLSSLGWEGAEVNRGEFSVAPLPPFRLDLTAWALRRRPENEMDRWDGESYRRVLTIHDRPVELAAQQIGNPERPRLRVTLEAARLTPRTKVAARSLLERMLGLRTDLAPFYKLAARDAKIAPLTEEFRGLKPPSFPSVFEAIVNGIACQQLSLLVGILLLNRLTKRFGSAASDQSRAFPDPAGLAFANVRSLRSFGFNTNKAKAIIELSRAIRDRRLDLEAVAALDNQAALERIQKIRGVGRWTAEYALLRGLGRLDSFPGDDVGAQKNLAKLLHVKRSLNYDGVQRVVAGWQPYAGFIYFHLLLAKIKNAGWLQPRKNTRGIVLRERA